MDGKSDFAGRPAADFPSETQKWVELSPSILNPRLVVKLGADYSYHFESFEFICLAESISQNEDRPHGIHGTPVAKL